MGHLRHMTLIGLHCWAEAPIKIARMTLTIKLDGNWSSFQLANSTPPLSVTDSAIAPSARMPGGKVGNFESKLQKFRCESHDTTLQLLPSAASSSSFSSSCCWAEALLADGVFTRCCLPATQSPPKITGLQGPVSSRGRSPEKFGIIPQ